MPLIFTGIVAVTEIARRHPDSDTKEFTRSTCLIPIAGTESGFVEIQVNSWTNLVRDVELPVEGAIYHLEGKFTFDEKSKMFIVEATRMVKLPDEREPMAPRITGTAIYQNQLKDDEKTLIVLHANCFASGISVDRLIMKCYYQPSQYTKFMAKLLSRREIFVTGVLDTCDCQKGTIHLDFSDFSFLSRNEAASDSKSKKATPKSWPIKKQKLSSSATSTTPYTSASLRDVAPENGSSWPIDKTPVSTSSLSNSSRDVQKEHHELADKVTAEIDEDDDCLKPLSKQRKTKRVQ